MPSASGWCQLGQGQQRLVGVGLDHAAAHVEHRPARLPQQRRRLAHPLGVRLDGRPVAREVERLRPGPLGGRLEHVLGDVDQHRARPPGPGDVERLGDRAGDPLGAEHQLVVLGDRQRDAGGVALLEGVRADHRLGHLAGDRHHRHRVHVGVRQRGDQVGRARATGRHADPDLAGRPGVPLRRMARPLLVADQDVANAGLTQRVVGRQDRATGKPEHDLDAALLEAADERLRSSDLQDDSLVCGFAVHGRPSPGKQKTSCRLA